MTNIEQKSGDYSINFQAQRDINFNIVISSLEDLARKLLVSVFGELPEDTKKQIHDNQMSYSGALVECLKDIKKQAQELDEIISSPDFQYMQKIALISASRSSSIELHKNLSSLIVQRINYDKGDLERIIYNEAISTISKLTIEQIKVITLCALFKSFVFDIDSRETFKLFLDENVSPFLDINPSSAAFDHIVYTSCGYFETMPQDILYILRNKYSNLFSGAEDETREEIAKNTKAGKKFLELWKDMRMKRLCLTSVGNIIAKNFYERTVGKGSINIEPWLNSSGF
jgi:hypothetical protein